MRAFIYFNEGISDEMFNAIEPWLGWRDIVAFPGYNFGYKSFSTRVEDIGKAMDWLRTWAEEKMWEVIRECDADKDKYWRESAWLECYRDDLNKEEYRRVYDAFLKEDTTAWDTEMTNKILLRLQDLKMFD